MNKHFSRCFLQALVFILLLALRSLPVSATPYDNEITDQYAILTSPPSTPSISQRFGPTETHSLQNKVIVIDPGHGGSDTGAIGPNHAVEKNITLAIASDLRKLLTASGATVIMTRTSDRDVAYAGASDIDELTARVTIANQANADAFVSIHVDAAAALAAGTTTYFCSGSNDLLARTVQTSMQKQLNLYDRGFQPSDFFVLKYTTMPAILTEVAFISNPKEERLLQSSTFDYKAALGIFNGLKTYFRAQ